MINRNAPLFENEPEIWDAETCERKANHVAKDGLGTPYPFKGYIGMQYGEQRYNGGCIRDNLVVAHNDRERTVFALGLS